MATEKKSRLLDFLEDSELKLSLDVLMQTIFIGGNKGAGKTSSMKRLFEAAHRAGAQCVAIAPLGRWWSLRIAKNGKGKGLRDVYVFGGKHGDAEIVAGSGRAIARAIVGKRLHAVLDVELMRKADRHVFLLEFLEELWLLKKQEDTSSPMVLFIDEAQVVAPQMARGKDADKLLDATSDLCREGRNHGLGMVLGAQRSANVHKDLLALVEMLIVMRTVHHLDRTVYKKWIDEKGEGDEDAYSWLRRLRRLGPGDAYLYIPEQNIFERVHTKLPETFDATKTAKLGERVAKIGRLSKMDVKKLGADLAEVVATSEANDPAKLRARVAELERERTSWKAKTFGEHYGADPKKMFEQAKAPKSPKLKKSDIARLEKLFAKALKSANEWKTDLTGLFKAAQPSVTDLTKALRAATAPPFKTHSVLLPQVPVMIKPERVAPRDELVASGSGASDPIKVVGAMKTMLAALAVDVLSRDDLATTCGVKPGSTFRAYVARLKQANLILEVGNTLSLTTLGRGEVSAPLDMNYGAIVSRAKGIVGGMARILQVVKDRNAHLSREEVSEAAGVPLGSTFRAYVARLKQQRLITEDEGGSGLALGPVLVRALERAP